MKFDKFEEQVFFTTVRITIPQQSGRGSSIGTGFIFKVKLNEPQDREVILLISNRHVFKNSSLPIELKFHKRKANSDSYEPDIGQIHTIHGDNFSHIYYEHPDPNIDLACINISLINNQKLNIYYRSLATDLICDFDNDDILPGSDVWFIGYPQNRFDVIHNLPILRRGYLGSIHKEKPRPQRLLLGSKCVMLCKFYATILQLGL